DQAMKAVGIPTSASKTVDIQATAKTVTTSNKIAKLHTQVDSTTKLGTVDAKLTGQYTANTNGVDAQATLTGKAMAVDTTVTTDTNPGKLGDIKTTTNVAVGVEGTAQANAHVGKDGASVSGTVDAMVGAKASISGEFHSKYVDATGTASGVVGAGV